jgi:signal transduction histidine kinase/CheY-like chemotaxis protein
MDTKHIPGEEAEKYTYDHLTSLCITHHFDAAIIGDDAALTFAMKYRDVFFKDTPIVFMGINIVENAEQAVALPLVTGTIEDLPFTKTIQLALKIYPKASKVLSITDGTKSGNAVVAQLKSVNREFPQLSFEELDSSKRTRSEIISELSNCGEDTILIYLVMSRDGEGNTYTAEQAAEFLSNNLNVPIFRADEMGMGNGFFGGCLISYFQMGEQTGDTVNEILGGAIPSDIKIKSADTRYEFDYEQMQRFHISESVLPVGSTILNRPSTYWSENKQTLIPASIIIALLLLGIVALYLNSRYRTHLQRKLQESQKLYQTAANSADLIIWEYDPLTKNITMSFDSEFTKRICDIRGISRVLENGPAKQAAVILKEDQPALLNMYKQIDAGAESAECKYGFQWEGTTNYRYAKATSVYDEKTNQRTVICIASDITNEQRIRNMYNKELQYLHQNNDGALTSKGHVDLTTGEVFKYELLAGTGVKPIQSKSYDEIMENFFNAIDNAEDKENIKKLADRFSLMKKFHEGERHLSYRYRRAKHGLPPAWVNLQCNMFVSPSTGHIECFMYSYDVTEQELKDQIISKLIDFGYENIGFVYPDTHTATAFLLNEPGMKQKVVNSLDYDDILRKVLVSSNTKESEETLFNALCIQTVKEHLSRDPVYQYSLSMNNEQGQEIRKQFLFSWANQKHETVFFCLTDTTKQYETAQRQIQDLSNAKLAAVKANEAKSAFLSSMSHDLRTPLNGIIGFTEIAIKETDPDLKQDYLEKIKLSGNLLLSLVNDTLDLSRIESGKMKLQPEDIDSRSFLESVLAAVRPVAEQKNIKLISNVERFATETIYVDRLKLQKVILNLLSNAIKYTPPGGTVCFTAENITSKDSSMTRRITVKDNGIGMKPEFLEKIYEPFVQEMRPEAGNVQGTGLGLSIVKKIVDLMGGTIQVQSEVNQGTTFIVDLPILLKEITLENQQKTESAAMNLSGKSVLLAEDNYLNAEIASLILKERGVNVTTAENGKQCAEIFGNAKINTFDAILMDIRMPIMNGYEATKKIRHLNRPDAKTIPIIAMTAEAFEEDIRRAKEAGMNGYITKPIDSKKMFTELEHALEDQSHK